MQMSISMRHRHAALAAHSTGPTLMDILELWLMVSCASAPKFASLFKASFNAATCCCALLSCGAMSSPIPIPSASRGRMRTVLPMMRPKRLW